MIVANESVKYFSKYLEHDDKWYEPISDVSLVFACLVVFGEDVYGQQEWP